MGPWVGEVVNGTQYPIDRAAVRARVLGADDAVLGGAVVPTCPAYLMPHERGTFEIFAPHPLSGSPPFRLETEKVIGGDTGPNPVTPPPYRPDGLSVKLLSKMPREGSSSLKSPTTPISPTRT